MVLAQKSFVIDLFQFLKRAEYFGKEKHGDDLLVFKILNSLKIQR